MTETHRGEPGRSPAVLDGIRVLDFSRIFAAPAATQLLGDLGADVIKIEEPDAGDDTRILGVDTTKPVDFPGFSPSFLALNRNKRSVGLDLRNSAGREVALKLAVSSDILVHNFRPGVMERWGLGYDEVAALNPRIVYCGFSAYGDSGPLAGVGANDVAVQAHSGLMSMTGPTNGEPVRSGTSVIDLTGSLAIVSAVMASLYHRERTGNGQRIDTSLLMSSAHLMSYFYTEYWMDGTIRKPMGTANHLSVPNQTFPASDGAVVIIAYADDMWVRCVKGLEAEAMDRPEYRTAAGRRLHRERLVADLSAITSKLTCEEILARLGGVRVVVSKVNSVGEAADHPQLAAIGGFVDFDVAGRRVRSVTAPFKLSRTPACFHSQPPHLGADTADVLRELGYDDDQIANLNEAGALGKVEIARAHETSGAD
jgi:crotonobetainyl-CoA:carnitine CoA-transferase CaiB-like acyl-CoA transferase